jgi:hypothetical protein
VSYFQVWWLMPVILATWEAKIRGIMVPAMKWEEELQDPISANKQKLYVT